MLSFLVGGKGLLQTSQKYTMFRLTQSSDTDLDVFCLRPPIIPMHSMFLLVSISCWKSKRLGQHLQGKVVCVSKNTKVLVDESKEIDLCSIIFSNVRTYCYLVLGRGPRVSRKDH